jgi:phosphatidylserine/phosphatidylglycerophosphate/cardiolipin synthase-like enzyme
MFKIFANKDCTALLSSQLYNEQSFYPAFIADARRATRSIIIESPFIAYKRLAYLYPALDKSVRQGVKVTINTRDPLFHEGVMKQQAQNGVELLQDIGVEVLYTGNHHRKLAIIDRHILYEGSLNILSQSDSCEIMRRIESEELSENMIRSIGLSKYLS